MIHPTTSIFVLISLVLLLTGAIRIIVNAFKVSLLQGLLTILIPFYIWIFIAFHFNKLKSLLIIYCIGLLFSLFSLGSYFTYKKFFRLNEAITVAWGFEKELCQLRMTQHMLKAYAESNINDPFENEIREAYGMARSSRPNSKNDSTALFEKEQEDAFNIASENLPNLQSFKSKLPVVEEIPTIRQFKPFLNFGLYNEAVENYNHAIKEFPAFLFSPFLGIKSKEMI